MLLCEQERGTKVRGTPNVCTGFGIDARLWRPASPNRLPTARVDAAEVMMDEKGERKRNPR